MDLPYIRPDRRGKQPSMEDFEKLVKALHDLEANLWPMEATMDLMQIAAMRQARKELHKWI